MIRQPSGLARLKGLKWIYIMVLFPGHQVRLDHVPDRPFSPVSVMGLGTLSIISVGPFNVIRGPGDQTREQAITKRRTLVTNPLYHFSSSLQRANRNLRPETPGQLTGSL